MLPAPGKSRRVERRCDDRDFQRVRGGWLYRNSVTIPSPYCMFTQQRPRPRSLVGGGQHWQPLSFPLEHLLGGWRVANDQKRYRSAHGISIPVRPDLIPNLGSAFCGAFIFQAKPSRSHRIVAQPNHCVRNDLHLAGEIQHCAPTGINRSSGLLKTGGQSYDLVVVIAGSSPRRNHPFPAIRWPVRNIAHRHPVNVGQNRPSASRYENAFVLFIQ